MEYIIRLKKHLTPVQEETLRLFVYDILFKSRYLPLVGVLTDKIDQVRGLDFVSDIRLAQDGSYWEDSSFSTYSDLKLPSINEKVLIASQFIGWGTKIAILDSGVNEGTVKISEHVDFTGTGSRDSLGHGTIVANIIKHFAKGASLYSIKVGSKRPNEISVMRGIEWAVEKDVDIINISVGFSRDCEGNCDLCELIDAVSGIGKIVVVAAGNGHNKEDSISCPGNAISAITVGATDGKGNVASYSSFGKPSGEKPNILAPGNVIVHGKLRKGTSFAAPMITGILGAIYKTVDNVPKLLEYLYGSAKDFGLPLYQQGVGQIDLNKLVGVLVNETASCQSQGQS